MKIIRSTFIFHDFISSEVVNFEFMKSFEVSTGHEIMSSDA